MKRFKINNLIHLKLVGKRTFIYINNERFLSCKSLVINIPKEDLEKFDSFESIDEISSFYDHYLCENQVYLEEENEENILIFSDLPHNITPEEEFWGHCSNIQAWVEHDYDTRILHSNLSFPLLEKLRRCNDPIAVRVFREEIVSRLNTGNFNTMIMLIDGGFLKYLNYEALKSILNPAKAQFFDDFINIPRWYEEIEKFNLFIETHKEYLHKNIRPLVVLIKTFVDSISWDIPEDMHLYDL